MSYLRFNHVFFGLMTMALLSAFVFSPPASERARVHVSNIFKPVSWPVGQLAGWTREKLTHQSPRDDGSPASPRSSDALLRENMELRIANMNLKGQLDRLKERQAEQEVLGPVGEFCTRFSVNGSDSAGRETMLVSGSSLDGLREGMPVLYPYGLVGRLGHVGVGEARVILITDPQSKLLANFARFVRQPDGKIDSQLLSAEPKVVEGAGAGELIIRDIPNRTIQELGLRVEDWLAVNDRDALPTALNHYRLGTIYAISPSKSPGFSNIHARPDQKLIGLREVMVMNKGK